jgi:plastocyanin
VRRPLLAATALGAVLAVALPAAAADLAGSVQVVDEGGRRLAGAAAEAVVWFVPDGGAQAPRAADYEMVTRRKRFEPRVLVVPVGSTVRFPNRDPILHNVFSVSSGNAFDLGLHGRGEGESHRFVAPGVVRVFCNVHHAMVAYVAVMPTPHYASPAADGRFRLRGVPAGPGTLWVWHERGEPQSRRLDPAASGDLSTSVTASRPLVPPHRNKLGRPYARSRRHRYGG